jgi:hypothetical protein
LISRDKASPEFAVAQELWDKGWKASSWQKGLPSRECWFVFAHAQQRQESHNRVFWIFVANLHGMLQSLVLRLKPRPKAGRQAYIRCNVRKDIV